MNALVSGGADCGPVNPLSQLSKVYGQDRSSQQDHHGAPRAGPSGSSFRSSPAPSGSSTPHDAARFFAPAQQQQQPHPSTFDLSPLNRALSPAAPPAWAQAFASQAASPSSLPPRGDDAVFRSAFAGPASGVAHWSNDFMQHQHQGRERSSSPQVQARQATPVQQLSSGPQQPRYGGMMPLYNQGPMPDYAMASVPHVQTLPVGQQSTAEWETAFSALDTSTSTTTLKDQQLPPSPTLASSQLPTSPEAKDALARTAAELLQTVSQTSAQSEQSTVDKFAQSTFLDLMRKLRDGEVAVEGDKVVEQIGREEEGRVNSASFDSTAFSTTARGFGASSGQDQLLRGQQRAYEEMNDVWKDEDASRSLREGRGKGKGKAVFQGDGGMVVDEDNDGVQDGSFLLHDERSARDIAMDTTVPLASSYWDEDFDASLISGGHAFMTDAERLRQKNRSPSAQQKEWDALQNDWDTFEATATGITPVSSTETAAGTYTFAPNNPYSSSSTRTHALHSGPGPVQTTLDSVLQREADVLRSPSSPHAWLALGIKQQENEREELAIRALTRALELDPSLGEASLALAVSYTNENERGKAYDAVDRWAGGLKRYAREVGAYRELFGPLPEEGRNLGEGGRHEYLTGLLIRLAREGGEEVDAEVQIALGVLFNTSEEYDKASDCFGAALSVRPDDPLLFNRLGATLANSGKTDQSIQYYLEALELHPGYVRARFNLAVASMNLGQYEQAVEHLMTSLSIQEEDVETSDENGVGATRGITSQTLWDSLNIALLMMHRGDLATLTATRDLAALRSSFQPAF